MADRKADAAAPGEARHSLPTSQLPDATHAPPAPVVLPVPRMGAAELRMRCLEAAIQVRTPGTHRGELINMAREFERYVSGTGEAPAEE